MQNYYYSQIIIDMETLEVIERESQPWFGQWELCLGGGATSADRAASVDETKFRDTLQQEQDIQFANEQEAQNAVKGAWSPLLANGPYQYGFSTAEDQALQGNIENAGATATENSISAEQLRQQQQSGGASTAPSGADAALELQARETGAQQTATNLSNEKLAGYQQGATNFENASKATEDVASLANPTGFAGEATGAAGAANTALNNVDTANQNSMTRMVLGGVIGAVGKVGAAYAGK